MGVTSHSRDSGTSQGSTLKSSTEENKASHSENKPNRSPKSGRHRALPRSKSADHDDLFTIAAAPRKGGLTRKSSRLEHGVLPITLVETPINKQDLPVDGREDEVWWEVLRMF